MSNHTIALIPAYEPASTLVILAKGLSEAAFSVLIIDDGSGPEYRSVFQAAERYATVISYGKNRGKGHALKTGLFHIKAHDGPCSVVVTLDADGQHAVEDACNVARRAKESPDALTLGTRTFGRGTPVRSRFGNRVTRAVYRLSTGTRVSDTQTGLRGFGAGLIPFLLGVDGERYEYEMNVLLACTRRNVPIREVKIATIYHDNNAGSHFHALRDSARIYKDILKFAASSFIGFLVDYGIYSLLVVLTAGLGTGVSVPLSNVTARVVSASVNFAINKKLVFRSDDSVLRTGAQYFALAACILCGNTFLLSWLVSGLGVNRFAAKLVTELTFFAFSWLFQRFLIFRRPAGTRAEVLK